MPNCVVISGYSYSIPEFLYLISETIATKYEGSSGDITMKYGIKTPSSPSGVSINKAITKAEYYDISKRIATFIENKSQAPNYVGSNYGNIQYQTIVYGLSKIGDYLGENSALPNTLSLNVPITHSMNKNLPVFNPNNNANTTSKLLGSNSLGTVELLGAFGNAKSNIKIAFIIGVEPLEPSIKQLFYDSIVIAAISQDYCCYIYRINVTKASNNVNEEKIYGQSLASEFAQPHIQNSNYDTVINLPDE